MGAISFLRNKWVEYKLSKIKKEIESTVTGTVMDKLTFLMFNAMSLLFLLNRDYRKNIKDFEGRYVIKSSDKKINVSAEFRKKKIFFRNMDAMEVKDSVIDKPTVEVTFRDGKAMAEFLFSGKPDVIVGMLSNQLSVSGNLNYLFKFVYMIMIIPELLGLSDFQKTITKALAKA